MNKLRLTLNQKRFLIIWTLFNSFALFVNVADFEGKVYESSEVYKNDVKPLIDTPSHIKDTITDDSLTKWIASAKSGKEIEMPSTGMESKVRFGTDSLANKIYIIRLFTISTNKSDFWPFTTYYKEDEPTSLDFHTTYCYFNGIFNSYDFSEYVFYIISGLAFVYVPKLWR